MSVLKMVSPKTCARALSLAFVLTGFLFLAPISTRAQDWPNVDVIHHATYQAVNADGSSAYPPGAFPIRLVGVVLNDSEDWLDPTENYLVGPMWAMGGQAEIYVQTVDPTDFGGTAAWMGQNYGNHYWHFPCPECSYSNAEWYAELDRLHLYRPDTPLPDAELVRAGDLVELRVRGGLNYKGKQNVNEQHENDSDFDFEIVILQKAYGLPYARPIAINQLKDAGNVDIFDSSRATGGEQCQSSRVVLRNVDFQNPDPANWHSNTDPDVIVENGTGRTFPVHLGFNPSFDTTDPPTGPFDVVGIMDQKSSHAVQCVDGYRVMAMHADDFHEVTHWTSSGEADWSTASNWHRGSPPSDGNSLVFDGAATPLDTNNDLVDANVFGITFAQRDGWQVGGNALTVSGYVVAEGNASVNVDLTLAANQAWDVAAGKALTVNGTVSGAANLVKMGAGQVQLNGATTLDGNVTVEEGSVNVAGGVTVQVAEFYNTGTINLGTGATLRLSHQWVTGSTTADPDDAFSALAGLTFGTGAVLDVDRSGVVLSGTDYATVVSMLDDALTQGSTAGQIVSSAATAANVADPAHPRSVAVVDDGDGNVTARYAANGDTDLDGKVKLADYVTLRSNYNPLADDRTWSQGDSNYDGDTDLADYIQLKNNYSPVFTYTAAPEPDQLAAAPGPGEVECIVNAVTGEVTFHGNSAQFEGIEIISPGSGLLIDQDTGPFFGGDVMVGHNQYYAEFAPLTGDPFELDGTQSLGTIYNAAMNAMDLEVNVGLVTLTPTYVVPEPGTLGMAAAVVLALTLASLRRRRRAARINEPDTPGT